PRGQNVTTKNRDALLGALFTLLIASAVVYLNVAHPERRTRLSYTLRACFEDLSRCRSQPFVRLEGVYAPATLLKTGRDCSAEFDLQSPGRNPPGRVHVCSMRDAPELEASCASASGALAV